VKANSPETRTPPKERPHNSKFNIISKTPIVETRQASSKTMTGAESTSKNNMIASAGKKKQLLLNKFLSSK
jgi:hypothetical protein